MKFPSYYIGTYQAHIDIATATRLTPVITAGVIQDNQLLLSDGVTVLTSPGQWHWWSPDVTLTPASVIFIVHRDTQLAPHPAWVALPHILDTAPVKPHLAGNGMAHVQAALALPIVTATDTTFSLVTKLHAQMPVFEP